MTQNLLGTGAEKYLLKLSKYKALTVVLGVLLVLVSALLLLLRTDRGIPWSQASSQYPDGHKSRSS